MTEEQAQYLDNLQQSGLINMYGCREYLMIRFGLSKEEAGKVFVEWANSYTERHPQ